jgi:hypothetical protein
MNRSFSLLHLLLGLAIIVSPGVALGQPQEESIRPMSVVPTDEPALAPRPFARNTDVGSQSLVLPISNQGKTTPSASTLNANAPDFKSPLSP